MNHYGSIIYEAGAFVSLFVVLAVCSQPCPADEEHDWRSDWGIQEGFNIAVDTEGFSFPSAIAFVPDPGKGPKDPLYFVLELRGKVKVVTNDRSVYTFAEGFINFTPPKELPDTSGENGLTGICLDPENGYVFVTFVYQDENNIMRNNVARFDTTPGTFSQKPLSMTTFTDVFSREGSSPAHQIGPCQVYENTLFVSVGDGYLIFPGSRNYFRSQDENSVLGKILRMTLDGKPVRSNPYYVDDDITKARNYVWAAGFRNPFGLKIVDGRVFVADNGPLLDRFIEVHKGENYLWDGSDMSIATNADVVFAPAAGVAQLDYYPEGLNAFPERFRGKFYQTLCGDPKDDSTLKKGRTVVLLDYSFEQNKVLSPPSTFLAYRGSGSQALVGLAIGPDGLYFVPIMPISDGRSVVFKVSYEPESEHPYTLGNETSAPRLLEERGCYGCHTYGGNDWGKAGPSLDSDLLVQSISARLSSEEYIKSVKKLDSQENEPYKSYREERSEVMGKKGIEKIRTWVKYHIIEPKFDNPYSLMPNLGIGESESETLSMFLIPDEPPLMVRMGRILYKVLPELKYRYLAYSFLLGFAVALVIAGGYMFIKRRK